MSGSNLSPPTTPLSAGFHHQSTTTPLSDLTASLSTISRRVASSYDTPPQQRRQSGLGWEEEQRELESELQLCAQIGQALLQRHEAYVEQSTGEIEGLRTNVAQMTEKLEDTNEKLSNVQQTNENLVSKLASSTRENQTLERRLLQSLTSLTLSDSSIATLRGELSSVRSALSRQAGAQARSTGWEDKIKVAERDRDELREELVAERKRAAEGERRWRKAEERISDLENKLRGAKKAIERANKTREDAAQEMVQDAKARLDMMKEELNNPGLPHPDVQLVLDALMADNVILKRDNTELREALAESQTQSAIAHIQSNPPSPSDFNHMSQLDSNLSISTYAYNPDDNQPISRSSTAFFSDELAASTASSRQNPSLGLDQTVLDSFGQHSRKNSWAPSIGSGAGGMGGVVRRERHGRNDSWTPSIASTSSYGFSGGLRSPTMDQDEEASFTDGGSRKYPLGGGAGRRPSRGGSSWSRGHVKRSFSVDRPKGVQRAFSQGVDPIAEWGSTESETAFEEDERAKDPSSPTGSNMTDAKNTSFNLPRRSSAPPHESGEGGPHSSSIDEPPFDLSRSVRPGGLAAFHDVGSGKPAPSPEKQKEVRRKPMMLLSRSKGVQTDHVEIGTSMMPTPGGDGGAGEGKKEDVFAEVQSPSSDGVKHGSRAFSPTPSSTPSTPYPSTHQYDANFISPTPPADLSFEHKSDTSSIHETRTGSLSTLISHMNLILTRISSASVPTLTKRLKRQHLPGDVGHLSKSTITSILAEVNDLRTHFRTVLDAERRGLDAAGGSIGMTEREKLDSLVTRKDFLSLVKLFKDIFSELSQLRGTVNDVILDPSMAVKLREAMLAEEAEEEARGRPRPKPVSRQTSGLGWIAKPISKFFVTPPVESGEEEASGNGGRSPGAGGMGGNAAGGGGGGPDRGRLHPSRTAPKLAAATSSTQATVNVEFASGGAVRRATTIASTPTPQLPPSPNVTLTRASASAVASSGFLSPPLYSSPSHSSDGSSNDPARPPRDPSQTRVSASSNRSNLRSIFAGSGPSSAAPPGRQLSSRAGGNGLRSVSSQVFRSTTTSSSSSSSNQPPPRPIDSSNSAINNPNRLSTIVDAVLDPSLQNTTDLDRPLRSTRSDESIRSHFLNPHPNPSTRLLSSSPRPAPSLISATLASKSNLPSPSKPVRPSIQTRKSSNNTTISSGSSSHPTAIPSPASSSNHNTPASSVRPGGLFSNLASWAGGASMVDSSPINEGLVGSRSREDGQQGDETYKTTSRSRMI